MNLTRALPVKLLMLVCMSFALAACGSEKEESEGERGEAFGTVCEMTQLSGDTGLPQDFPFKRQFSWGGPRFLICFSQTDQVLVLCPPLPRKQRLTSRRTLSQPIP